MVDTADRADKVIELTKQLEQDRIAGELRKDGDNPEFCESCGGKIHPDRRAVAFKVVECITCADIKDHPTNIRRRAF